MNFIFIIFPFKKKLINYNNKAPFSRFRVQITAIFKLLTIEFITKVFWKEALTQFQSNFCFKSEKSHF